ncbi:peroxisome assembly protein (Peroxin-2) [Coemansia sp. RSA 2399]|nr:peroxisome assembly protein (Peroxin-2) [Coemansia sp. RSA 2399]KAJ1896987.1 peroxisome assembly protein (Peroxin-2) [Coemansia sp. IMI 209127]
MSATTLPPQQAPQQPWKHTWRQTALSQQGTDSKMAPVVPRSGRVNKLDAELLDVEVSDMIREPVRKAFSLMDSRLADRYGAEVDLVIHGILFWLSVGAPQRRATYGQMVQNLAYAPTGRGFARRLWWLGLATVVGPYVWRRAVASMSARGWANQPANSSQGRAWLLVQRAERAARLVALVNFVGFLGAGQYRTVVERLLGLRLVSVRPQMSHTVSFEFLNRQLVWHAFTEFVMFAVPLVNAAKARAWVARQMRAAVGISASASVDPAVAALPPSVCAICVADAESPADADPDGELAHRAANPYVTPCGHTYCYVCIKMRMMAEADECACLRCGKIVDRIYRLAEPADPAEND